MMKLKQYINNNFSDRDILYIGSMSAYFFIGTKEQFYEDCEMLNKQWQGNFVKCVADNERKLKMVLDNRLDLKAYTEKVRKQEKALYIKKPLTDKEIKDNYKKEVEKTNNAITNLKATIKRSKAKLKTFKPFTEREVQRCFVKDVETGYAIIVSGFECASYWFEHEYDRTRGRELEEIWDQME